MTELKELKQELEDIGENVEKYWSAIEQFIANPEYGTHQMNMRAGTLYYDNQTDERSVWYEETPDPAFYISLDV